MSSGDPDQVRKYQSLMSTGELQDAINRIAQNQKLKDMSPSQEKQMKNAEEKINDLMKHVKTASTWISILGEGVKQANNLYVQANSAKYNYDHFKSGNFGKPGVPISNNQKKDDQQKGS